MSVSSLASDERRLEIQLGSTEPGLIDPDYPPFWSAEVRWRAAMAAAVVAEGDQRITSVAVDPGVPIADADNSLIDAVVFREGPGTPTLAAEKPRLGSLTEADARAQLQATAKTLIAAGGVKAVNIEPVTLDSGANQFGFIAVVSVEALPDRKHARTFFGNVFNGLGEGLASGANNDLIEGLGVVVERDNVPVAAAFQSSRAGSGQVLAVDSLDLPNVFRTSLEFENLTDGPSVKASFSGAPPRFPVQLTR